MTLQELKQLRDFSEGFWKHWDKKYQRHYGDNPVRHSHNQHWKGIIIENDLSGVWVSETSNLGQKVRRFQPRTDGSYWSCWRVGIPVKYKGSRLMLWVRGYHCGVGEDIMWIPELIWNIDTNKEMRKSAQDSCWTYMRGKASVVTSDVSGVRLTRWVRPFQSDGWKCEHNGIVWQIYPAASYKKDYDGIQPVTDVPRTYWVQHEASGVLARHCKTLKEAKVFIKKDGAIWLTSRLNYSAYSMTVNK